MGIKRYTKKLFNRKKYSFCQPIIIFVCRLSVAAVLLRKLAQKFKHSASFCLITRSLKPAGAPQPWQHGHEKMKKVSWYFLCILYLVIIFSVCLWRERKIKYRKRKSGKKNSTDEENLPIIVDWRCLICATVCCHCILVRSAPTSQRSGAGSLSWGVTLQYYGPSASAFCHWNGWNLHCCWCWPCPDCWHCATGKGDLRKCQFTANIYVNAGEGDKCDGYACWAYLQSFDS